MASNFLTSVFAANNIEMVNPIEWFNTEICPSQLNGKVWLSVTYYMRS